MMKFDQKIGWRAAFLLSMVWLSTSGARADVVTGFEAPEYTAGSSLVGQNGWYNPVAGSVPYDVLTYAGNPLGLPANPNGGSQFVGVAGTGVAFGRSQLDVDFSTSSIWAMSYDVAHGFNGSGAATQNLGSLSTQNPLGASRGIIALHTWTDVLTPTNWNAAFNVADAAGTVTTQSPGVAWNNLIVNNWYRESFTFDLSTNLVLSVSITDLSTNITNTFNPTGWYLAGGQTGGGLLAPSAFRLFAGGSTDGNIGGWDNLSVTAIPEPGTAVVFLGIGALTLLGRRRSR